MKTSSPFIYFCPMDGFFRIFIRTNMHTTVLVHVIFPASLNSNILLFYDIKIECTIYRLTLYRQARLAQI